VTNITSLPSSKDNSSLKKSPSLSTTLLHNDPKIDFPIKFSVPDEVMNTFLFLASCRSGCERKTPSRFVLMAVDEITILGNVNLIFITGEPKTY